MNRPQNIPPDAPHPANWARFGRRFVETDGAERPPRLVPPPDNWRELCAAYTTAQLRAYGYAGSENRTQRGRSWAMLNHSLRKIREAVRR